MKAHYRLPDTELAVNHVIIVDEVDRPETRCLAMIAGTRHGLLEAWYLADSINDERPVGVGFRSTPLAQFGYHCLTDGKEIWVEQFREESLARYPDGEPRRWQGSPTGRSKLSRVGQSVIRKAIDSGDISPLGTVPA